MRFGKPLSAAVSIARNGEYGANNNLSEGLQSETVFLVAQ
jgi:hypothetical protein